MTMTDIKTSTPVATKAKKASPKSSDNKKGGKPKVHSSGCILPLPGDDLLTIQEGDHKEALLFKANAQELERRTRETPREQRNLNQAYYRSETTDCHCIVLMKRKLRNRESAARRRRAMNPVQHMAGGQAQLTPQIVKLLQENPQQLIDHVRRMRSFHTQPVPSSLMAAFPGVASPVPQPQTDATSPAVGVPAATCQEGSVTTRDTTETTYDDDYVLDALAKGLEVDIEEIPVASSPETTQYTSLISSTPSPTVMTPTTTCQMGAMPGSPVTQASNAPVWSSPMPQQHVYSQPIIVQLPESAKMQGSPVFFLQQPGQPTQVATATPAPVPVTAIPEGFMMSPMASPQFYGINPMESLLPQGDVDSVLRELDSVAGAFDVSTAVSAEAVARDNEMFKTIEDVSQGTVFAALNGLH
eukprot:GFYU01003084.1.p1 GENE.GFYU01003084.1~~GFYU01003084.1.p1  ORF type:complete len:414 (+),score=138.04 GFYU01003084.1:329-1570(+)